MKKYHPKTFSRRRFIGTAEKNVEVKSYEKYSELLALNDIDAL